MNPHRSYCASLIAITFTLGTASCTHAGDIPRYRFQIGQQFVFHGERSAKRTGSEASTSDFHLDWKVDVLAQNADGSWRVADMVDSGGIFHQGTMNVPYERVVEAGVCDLYPDGMLQGNDDPLINLSRLFPRLPSDQKQLADGWDDQSMDHARINHFQIAAAGKGDDTFSFTGSAEGGIVGVFEPGSRQTYEFNQRIGAVDKIQLETGSSDPTFTERGEIHRTVTKQLDPSIVQKIAGLASDYDQALASYKSAVTQDASAESTKAAQARLAPAAKNLIAGMFYDGGVATTAPAESVNDAVHRWLGDAQPKTRETSLDDAVNAMVPDPPSEKDVLNQTAPAWSASDLAGNKHSLDEFRGKVLLLDFGSRGCTWCIREIPQLIRLANDFKDQPVAIIDMDLDQDPADAKFVMNAMRMPYLMLMAAEVKGYPIEGTPTVVIVDQTGVMRRRFIGYDMTGYDQMKSAIESLLPDKAKQGSLK